MYIHEDIEKVLISEQELAAKVEELAAKISADFEGREVLVVTLLKGGVMFSVDLMRKLTVPVEIDFMNVSSYGASSKTSGVVKIDKDLDKPIAGKNVLLVEDIIDSGNTLSKIKALFEHRNAKSVRICTLLDKPSRRVVDVKVDYVGKEIPDEFVIGYGLDCAENYRNLPYIAEYSNEE